MGEYADDYFRKEVKEKHGFDPGSMYSDSKPRKDKVKCVKCGKLVKAVGLSNHLRDVHKITNPSTPLATTAPLEGSAEG